MFSRIAPALVITIAVCVGVLSCAPKVGEDPPEDNGRQFSGASCLAEASRVVKKFVFGEASQNEVADSWDCITSALVDFNRSVRGDSRDSYTPQELATFFEKNFLRSTDPAQATPQISPALQTEFMKIKQIFAGGGRTLVTRGEVQRLISLFGQLKDLSLRINPYMKVFIMSWKPEDPALQDAEIEHFENANRTIQEVARELGGLIQENHQAYHLDDAVVFLDELAKFFRADWTAADQVRKFLPVIKKIKTALTGGSEEDVLANEWRTMLLLGSRGYVQYLRYHYFIETPMDAGRSIRINYVARTFEDSFSVFEDLVREKPSGVVTKEEIVRLLTAFEQAWPTFKWSQALVDQFMNLKQVLFGGSVDAFAVSDFRNARLKVPLLSQITERVLPYYIVFGGEWNPQDMDREEAFQYFQEAVAALESSARELGGLFEASYDVRNLGLLLAEWQRLYPPEEGTEGSGGAIQKYVPVLVTLKNIVFEENDPVIKKPQWPHLLGFGSRLYSVNLFSAFFLKDMNTQNSQDLGALSVMTDMAFDVVNDMLEVKPSKSFSRAEVNRLATELQGLGVLPKDIGKGSLESAVRAFVTRVAVPPERRLAKGAKESLRLENIAYVRGELQGWLQTQMFLNDLFGGQGENSVAADALWKAIERRSKDDDASPELKKSLKELLAILSTNVRFVFDAQKRLIIGSTYKYNLRTMEMHNMLRAGTRLLISSYAGSLSRIRNGAGVTLSEAETAMRDFRGVAVDLDLIESSNRTFMTNRFREANLFMPHSNGDGLASFQEVHEILSAIISGLSLDGLLKGQLIKTCRGGKRSNSSSVVSYACLYNVYRQIFPSRMTSMPVFLAYQRAQTNEVFNFYFGNALKAAGHVPNSRNSVKLADVSLLPHLIQYIELVFARYDSDDNGGLTVKEALRAFPSFRALFKQMAKDQLADGTLAEEDLPALFTYILKYGKPPSGFWEGVTQWYPWKNDPSKWDIYADRTKIAQILGYIADQVSGAGAPIESVRKPKSNGKDSSNKPKTLVEWAQQSQARKKGGK